MNPANLSPAHVSEGQKRRTLRGFDGRLRHVETMEAGRAFALVDIRNENRALLVALDKLTARVEALEAHPAVSVPPVETPAQ